jgi:hypothetical protein
MARQLVGIGSSANDGTGDTLRDGIDKVNDNFIEIYGKIGDGTTIGTFTTPTIEAPADFTLDVVGDIILDSDGATIGLKDGGTLFGAFINSSGQLQLRTGSSLVTALTFSGADATLAGVLTTTGIVATKTASSSDVASSSGAVTSNVNSISHTLTLGGTLADDARHADVTVTSSKVATTSTIIGAASINADVHVHTIASGSFKFAFTNRSGGTLADDSTAIFNFVII